MQSTLTPLILVILSAIGYYGYAEVSIENVRAKIAENERVANIIQTTVDLGNRRDELLESRNNLSQRVKSDIENTLPVFNEQSIPKILLDLNTLALQTPIILDELTSSTIPYTKDGLIAADLSFTINTDYSNLKSFLANFQTWLKAALIEEITIRPNVGGSSQISADVKVTAYFISNN